MSRLDKTALLLDIGSGTQDVFYHVPGLEIENCPKFVLPAPARRIAEDIREATAEGRALHLSGTNMGGGFFRALKAHMDSGLPATATPEAALAIFDDPTRIESIGATLSDEVPTGARVVELADFDRAWWKRLLDAAGLDYPEIVCAAAQDHGSHPESSNRRGRFLLWEKLLLEHHGDPASLLYAEPPAEMTRLHTLQQAIGGGPVADTGAAAVLGALFDRDFEAETHRRGLTLLNIGNSHTIAFLLYQGRIHGVFEHHTGLFDADKLLTQLSRFQNGQLSFDEIFDDRGHGCLTLDLPDEAAGFAPIHVLGPQRHILDGRDVSFPAPGGDMMLAGAFGLLKGLEDLKA